MSDANIETIIASLNDKIAANGGPEFPVKFVMPGEDPVIVGPDGVSQGEGEAEVTLRVTAENLAGVLTGRINPAMAFIAGKIQVEGDHSKASSLRSILL